MSVFFLSGNSQTYNRYFFILQYFEFYRIDTSSKSLSMSTGLDIVLKYGLITKDNSKEEVF